jgi:hypothetical protein
MVLFEQFRRDHVQIWNDILYVSCACTPTTNGTHGWITYDTLVQHLIKLFHVRQIDAQLITTVHSQLKQKHFLVQNHTSDSHRCFESAESACNSYSFWFLHADTPDLERLRK